MSELVHDRHSAQMKLFEFKHEQENKLLNESR